MKYNLYSFEYRIIVRLSLFIHKIINFDGPPTLKNNLIQKNLSCKYNLRNNNNYNVPFISNHFGEYNFKYFFSNFINLTCTDLIHFNFNNFKLFVEKNAITNYSIISKKFDKYDLANKISDSDNYR